MTDILILLIIVCAYAILTAFADKRQLARCDDLLSGVFPMACNQYSSFGTVSDWPRDNQCVHSETPAVNGEGPSCTCDCNDVEARDADGVPLASTIYEAC